MVGDRVVVHKAGDVIPEIVQVVEEKGNVRPFVCPDASPARQQSTASRRRLSALIPPPAQVIERIIHFASRGMDITASGVPFQAIV